MYLCRQVAELHTNRAFAPSLVVFVGFLAISLIEYRAFESSNQPILTRKVSKDSQRKFSETNVLRSQMKAFICLKNRLLFVKVVNSTFFSSVFAAQLKSHANCQGNLWILYAVPSFKWHTLWVIVIFFLCLLTYIVEIGTFIFVAV